MESEKDGNDVRPGGVKAENSAVEDNGTTSSVVFPCCVLSRDGFSLPCDSCRCLPSSSSVARILRGGETGNGDGIEKEAPEGTGGAVESSPCEEDAEGETPDEEGEGGIGKRGASPDPRCGVIGVSEATGMDGATEEGAPSFP